MSYEGHFPSAEQVDVVATKFEEIAKKHGDGGLIDMGLSCISPHPCGTVACHAGWYKVNEVVSYAYSEGTNRTIAFDKQEIPIGFTDGANLIAADLGFSHYDKLKSWAVAYPEIWGNNEGSAMFINEAAFFPDGIYSNKIMLLHIADWWRAVHKRVLELETQFSVEDFKNELKSQLEEITNERNKYSPDGRSRQWEDDSNTEFHQSRARVRPAT